MMMKIFFKSYDENEKLPKMQKTQHRLGFFLQNGNRMQIEEICVLLQNQLIFRPVQHLILNDRLNLKQRA